MAPRWRQDGPKIASRWLNLAQDGPLWFPNGHNMAWEVGDKSKMAQKWLQMASTWPRKGVKMALKKLRSGARLIAMLIYCDAFHGTEGQCPHHALYLNLPSMHRRVCTLSVWACLASFQYSMRHIWNICHPVIFSCTCCMSNILFLSSTQCIFDRSPELSIASERILLFFSPAHLHH